jgi:hypothetical protein
VNDQPPATTLAIPPDFVRQLMESIGLGTREVGLNAMVERLKRYAREAEARAALPAAAPGPVAGGRPAGYPCVARRRRTTGPRPSLTPIRVTPCRSPSPSARTAPSSSRPTRRRR